MARSAALFVRQTRPSSRKRVNDGQRQLLARRVTERFGDVLTHMTIGVWGLAFKPGTDDMREAPSLVVIEELLKRGARVRAYDPVAMRNAAIRWAGRGGFELASDPYAAAADADALLVLTEWREFRSPDFSRLRRSMKQPVIFDGRNVFDPALMSELGFDYVAVGRAAAAPATPDTVAAPALAA